MHVQKKIAKDLIDFCRAGCVTVIAKSSPLHGSPNAGTLVTVVLPEILSQIASGFSNQDFCIWFKEVFHPLPHVGNQACSRPGCFKNTGWRRKSNFGHRIAIDVQNHAGRAVHDIVPLAWNMTDPAHVCG